MTFKKWVEESEREIKPLVDEASLGGVIIPEGYEEKLIQLYLTYKIVRVTWFLAISSIILSMVSILISLVSIWY